MKIQKDSIDFNGKAYPAVSIELTEEEAEKHYRSEYNLFADSELWDDICKNGEPDRDICPDTEIDFYMDNQECDKFCKGKISEGEMKFKIAREILSW